MRRKCYLKKQLTVGFVYNSQIQCCLINCPKFLNRQQRRRLWRKEQSTEQGLECITAYLKCQTIKFDSRSWWIRLGGVVKVVMWDTEVSVTDEF